MADASKEWGEANDIGKEAHARYKALLDGVRGGVSPQRQAVLQAEWQAIHHSWYAAVQRALAKEAE
ncbi:MAG: hypothetical protein JST00_11630 [Deltaproteobacteria bacterium]|nr:hypothetical protein [Deltaproteobacteria bacterium]